MRKIVLFVLLLALLVISSVVQAKSGSAVIPFYYFHRNSAYSDVTKSIFYISNITDQLISVNVTLFSYDGTIYKVASGDHVNIYNTNSYNLNNINSTISFELNPNTTTYMVFSTDLNLKRYGYGVIEWTQDSNNTYGLVASGSFLHSEPTVSRFALQINEGMPF